MLVTLGSRIRALLMPASPAFAYREAHASAYRVALAPACVALAFAVVALVVLAGSALAAEGPIASPAASALAATPLGTGAGDQKAPAVAWSETPGLWLVAWQDHSHATVTGVSIEAVRVDAGGSPLESAWLLAGDSLDRTAPAVAGGGAPGAFLVVYERKNAGGGLDIAGRLVNGDGSLPGSELTLANGSDWEYAPVVAWSPALSEYLVVWSVGPAPLGVESDLWARRVGANGSLLGSAVRLTSDDGLEDQATLVPDTAGGGWLVAWRASEGAAATQPDLWAMRLGTTGAPAAPAFALAATDYVQQRPRLASRPDSGQILAVWQDQYIMQDETFSVVAQLVQANGTLINAPMSLADLGPGEDCTPAASWAPGIGGWLTGWHSFLQSPDPDLYARMLLADAVPRESAVTVSATGDWEGWPDVATGGQFDALLVWEDGRGSPSDGLDVYGQVLRPGVVTGHVYVGRPPATYQPMPGVRVTLYGSQTSYTFDKPILRVTTGADGAFRLPYLQAWPHYQLYKLNPPYHYSSGAYSPEGRVVPSGSGYDWISFDALGDGEHGGNAFWVVGFASDMAALARGPGALALSAPRPNPASGPVTLSLRGGLTGRDRIEVFDARGRRVRSWEGERALVPAGDDGTPGSAGGAGGGGGGTAVVAADAELRWDGRLQGGEPAPAGLYLVRVRNGDETAVREVIVGVR